jgi:hypothetical protein
LTPRGRVVPGYRVHWQCVLCRFRHSTMFIDVINISNKHHPGKQR